MSGLIIVAFLSLLSLANCKKIEVHKDLACDTKNNQIYYTENGQKSCNGTEVCNLMFNGYGSRCGNTETCFNMFNCTSSTTFNVFGQTFSCPEYHKCNTKFEWPCQPCIRETCKIELYTCDPCQKNLVKIMGVQPFKCNGTDVCNKNYYKPCDMCIPKENDDSIEPGVAEEILSVDCNDGNAAKYPCRRHCTNPDSYFRCMAVVTGNWTREVGDCDNLYSDSICKNQKIICPNI